MKILYYLLILILFLASCATDMRTVDREVGAGQPDGYKQGYRDGCDSGNVAAGHPYYRFSKDVSRYSSDNFYKQGWDDGYGVCKGSYESIQRSMRR
jgi:hypothetical protein